MADVRMTTMQQDSVATDPHQAFSPWVNPKMLRQALADAYSFNWPFREKWVVTGIACYAYAYQPPGPDDSIDHLTQNYDCGHEFNFDNGSGDANQRPVSNY